MPGMRLFSSACWLLSLPPLFGSAYHHLAGVHGAAFRTVHPQHSCLVHHCDDPYLVACPDLIRRRYPYPSGFRYSHVAIGIDPARYLRILHHGRRAESGSYTNVFQMLLLIFVSATLTIAGLYKVGGVSALAEAVPADYWNLFRPNDDPAFPWLPIILGYPIMGVWFWCTDQSMVQPVLAAKNLKEGQMGANFTGWLKILDVPLYILPGIICLALYPGLKNPDEAYMTMVTNLFPVGMVGLVLAVLTAALISTVGSALNALSTVFTMDIYVKKFRPLASQKEIIRTGHVVTVAGALISVIITIAIDSIKGLNLFNVFQSVLGFIAPPMAAVFLFGIFWKRTTTMAANMALTLGTAFSMGVGILYLWVFPAEEYTTWPHFMMLSFYLFVIISAGMILVSLLDKHRQECTLNMKKVMEKPAKSVILAWALLAIVMVGLYLFFNGH